ncbi:MAG: ATP-dependent DNA helicase UvrD2 [Actinomycetota bacterium]
MIARDVLEGLNPQQTEAAQAVRGPVCILAGAGTGKTTTITRRIANQVVTGTFRPESILAVTFTKKAAGELSGRLAALGVASVRTRTFHAAALRQLGFFAPDRAGRVLAGKGRILYRLARSLPKPYCFQPAGDLATEIEWARNQRIHADTYLDSLGDHQPPIPADLMARTFARYEKDKSQEGLMDFEDVLERTVEMFADDEYALERFRVQYEAFTVDEYQDVNLLQKSLLDMWLGERDDLCVVGDDYQSIYSFTGATPDHLLAMPAAFPRTRVFRLEENYRSTPQIVAIANRLVPQLGGAEKMLQAVAADGPEPTLKAFHDPQRELDFLIEEMKVLHEQGVPWEEMAILYRINAMSEDYEEGLSAAAIPYQVQGGSFLTRPAGRSLGPRLKRARATTEVAAFVAAAAAKEGYSAAGAGDAGQEEQTRQRDLGRFIQLAQQFDDGSRTIAEFVTDLEQRFLSESDGRGVNLLTLHRAKGLEWKAVFIPSVIEGDIPYRRAVDTNLDEERRLFYVGLTRAKRYLTLSWVAGGRKQPSRFLRELGVLGAGEPAGSRRGSSSRSARSGGGSPPLRTPARRLSGVVAEVALEVQLSGGFRGRITTVGAEDVTVAIDGGASMTVPYGESVIVDGVSKPLLPPETGIDEEEEVEADESVVQALKAWRLERSRSDKMPAFIILHDKTLTAIAAARPTTMEALANISGMGPTKCDRYGTDILTVLSTASSS